MRYDNQVLFDKGLTTIAYQLEAMMDKAPELADDFDNLSTAILDLVNDIEDIKQEQYDQGYDEGHAEGYAEAEWQYSDRYDEGFEDGRQEGYEDGFQEGLEAGKES